VVVGEGATIVTCVTGTITMLIIGILLNIAGLGLILLGTLHACRLCGTIFRWYHRRVLFISGWNRSVRRHRHRLCRC
jgi:hypothetical protein